MLLSRSMLIYRIAHKEFKKGPYTCDPIDGRFPSDFVTLLAEPQEMKRSVNITGHLFGFTDMGKVDAFIIRPHELHERQFQLEVYEGDAYYVYQDGQVAFDPSKVKLIKEVPIVSDEFQDLIADYYNDL